MGLLKAFTRVRCNSEIGSEPGKRALLNLLAVWRWVRVDGSLSKFWLKAVPVVRWVSVRGRLYIFPLKSFAKVKWVSVEGRFLVCCASLSCKGEYHWKDCSWFSGCLKLLNFKNQVIWVIELWYLNTKYFGISLEKYSNSFLQTIAIIIGISISPS